MSDLKTIRLSFRAISLLRRLILSIRFGYRLLGPGLIALGFCAFVGPSLFAGLGFPHYCQQDLAATQLSPTLSHWAGTDLFGRDLFVRTLVGTQISLTVGLFGAAVSLGLGTVYGALAGFQGGKFDQVLMRIVDIMDSLPYLFWVIVLVSLFGKSLTVMFVTLGSVGWLMTARIVRSEILALKELDFIMAARSLGARPARLLWVHLIPNTFPTLIVYFTLTVPNMILQEAFLSFLGMGVQAPEPSLGSLIGEGVSHLHLGFTELCIPGCTLVLILTLLNRQGEKMRESQIRQFSA